MTDAAPAVDGAQVRPLADRGLDEPLASRVPPAAPWRAEAMARHAEALATGRSTYRDPATGHNVMTAASLARRGTCCSLGCRHCPYAD